jgi:hypothetical protein
LQVGRESLVPRTELTFACHFCASLTAWHEVRAFVRFVPLDMQPQNFTASTAEIRGEHLVLKNSRAKLVASPDPAKTTA